MQKNKEKPYVSYASYDFPMISYGFLMISYGFNKSLTFPVTLQLIEIIFWLSTSWCPDHIKLSLHRAHVVRKPGPQTWSANLWYIS